MRLFRSLAVLLAALALFACGDDAERTAPSAQDTTTGEREAPAEGRRELVVGIGDQKPDMFRDERWRELGLQHARYVTPWNAIEASPDRLDDWLSAARKAGVEPLIAFNHALGDQCPAHPCEAPAPDAYEKAFRAFHERYPWVTVVSPWNEANHASQPTGRRPDLAAAYFDVVARVCPDCTIVAADVLTSSNLRRWLATFEERAETRARLFGLHNYPDTNRFRSAGTEEALRLLDGEVWVTETGGIVEFTTASGRAAFPPDAERAARAVRHAFRLARSSPRIRRLYLYQWQKTNPQDRFDAGLIAPDGSARPALDVLREELRG